MLHHETAIIAPGAEIDSNVEIGPYCVIGPRVKIGAGSRLISHVSVDNDTTIGKNNVFYPFSSIGSAPQDLKFKGERSRLAIGDHNTIREGVTINIGTTGGGLETRIGDRCLFMAHSHVAHDCLLGNYVIMANSVGLAGHVSVGDFVIFGGMAGVHQFCKIGRHAFISAGTMVGQNVPPFCIAQGDRARVVGINTVGLRRAGWSSEKIQVVRVAFKGLFLTATNRLHALNTTEAELAHSHHEVKELVDFIRDAERGICPPRMNLSINGPDD